MSDVIGILGSGGQADETQSYAAPTAVAFRAVDKKYIEPGLIDISAPKQENQSMPVVAAVGAPALRRQLVETWPGNRYYTVVSKAAHIDETVELGDGCVVSPGSVITTNVKIGDHVLINIGVTVSHDCKLGNYVTISPGAHIAGHVILGDGVFVGIGAAISNGVSLASGVVVGAGAVVLEDITEPNVVVAGVPAKTIKVNQGWLSEL